MRRLRARGLAFVFAVSTLTLAFGCTSSSSGATSSGAPGDAGSSGTNTDADTPVVSTCAPLSGPGTEHNKDVFADETWGPGLHNVTYNVYVSKKATLTLSPCAVVRVAKGFAINIGGSSDGEDGVLVAEGKPDQAIVIEGATADKWKELLVSSKGQARLRYVTLRGAGDENSRNGAVLDLYGDPSKPLQALAKVDHVTIENGGRYGVALETHGGFSDDSSDLTVRGSGELAMRVSASAVRSIPTGKYTGNGTDAFRLVASLGYDAVVEDQIIHDRGVPYVIGGDKALSELAIQGEGGTIPTLTIEAGVVLKFPKADRSSGVWVDRTTSDTPAKAILKVQGTAAKPVLFTSAEATPMAGDWVGVVFGGIPHADSRIEYLRVDYAGGDTGTRGYSCGTPGSDDPLSNEAGIAILGKPSSQFITNTTIAHSAKNGFERGWLGDAVDFLPTNKFENIAFCTQTSNRPAVGSCPDPAPCPK